MQQIKMTQGAFERESNSLAIYLKEIRKIRMLTPQEECKLIKEYRAGNEYALEKIVSSNLRFVVSLAKHYQHKGMDLSDLINEGNIGLIKAVERYDETKGFKFISYAIWWIRQSIMQALTQNSRIIRLPRHKFASLNKATELFKQLEQKFEREPTVEELSQLLGVETDVIKETLGCEVKHLSIDAPVSVYEATSLLEVIENKNAELPDNNAELNESLETAIRHLFAVLNENQSEVVTMYYGLGGNERMNHNEISKKLQLSSERIRQIREAALKRIKESNQCRKLEAYMTV